MNKIVVFFFFILLIICNYVIWTSLYEVIQNREMVQVPTEHDHIEKDQKYEVEENPSNENILSSLNIPWIVSFVSTFLLFMLLTVSRLPLLTYAIILVGCLLGGGIASALGEITLDLSFILYLFLSGLGGFVIGLLCLILDNMTDKDTNTHEYYTFKEIWTLFTIVRIQFYKCLQTNKVYIKIGKNELKEFFKLR